MKIKRNVIYLCCVLVVACSQAPVQKSLDGLPQKVSRDYEAIGDATGIHPYVYGKHTLIKFDSGKSFSMSIKDEQGASVGYKVQAGYYVLDRKLDMFTVSGSGRLVQFSLIPPEAPIEDESNINTTLNEIEVDTLSTSENIGAQSINRRIKSNDPIYAIMHEQMKQHRKLLNIASENSRYTGEELFQINSRLDLIEYIVANKDEAIIHVYFPFNNTVFKPDADLINALLPIAKDAIRINIYGRTDSKIADDGNKIIAKGRVVATKEFLVNHGIPESVIYTYPRASGDFIAPEGMEDGRKLNRRVTIELVMQ